MVHEASNINDNELLARFIVSKRWIKSSDHAIRFNAFMPPPDRELSVTRHLDLSEKELWRRGNSVALQMQKELHGRADISVIQTRAQKIDVVPDPLPDNANHACLIDWPTEKEKQILIAKEIAASANFVPVES